MASRQRDATPCAAACRIVRSFGSTRPRFHPSQTATPDESIGLKSRCDGMVTTPTRSSSSVIRGAWYLPERRQLDLLFTSGRRYVYADVPPAVASRFAEAQSKGRFYNVEIRDRFPRREVGEVGHERSAA
jgi:hypothetical protein